MLFYVIAALFFLWCVYALLPTCYYNYFHNNHLKMSGDEKLLWLSFDDGPDPKYTYRLLSILHNYNVKAIFFLPAFKAIKYPDIVRQIIAEGHLIGSHSYKHDNPWLTGPFHTKVDFDKCTKAWKKLGIQPKFYRPPYGFFTIANLVMAKKNGLTPLLWTVLVGDWKNCGKDELLQKLRNKVSPLAIICLHDSDSDTGGEEGAPLGTLAAVKSFIPEALEGGFTFFNLKNKNKISYRLMDK